jgi:hypothetical protein
MENLQKPSKIIHITLWVAQVTLAVLFMAGAIMKFQPIETISAMMPWTGQVPVWIVRLLGLIDLLAAVGLILPSMLRIKPQLTPWAALSIITLMFSAIVFHVSRGEASVTGVNIISAIIALFIVWGRLKKAPITAR